MGEVSLKVALPGTKTGKLCQISSSISLKKTLKSKKKLKLKRTKNLLCQLNKAMTMSKPRLMILNNPTGKRNKLMATKTGLLKVKLKTGLLKDKLLLAGKFLVTSDKIL